MSISTAMGELLNKQITKEFESEKLYLSIASYFLEEELNGFANFFLVQAQEENSHAMRQFHYLHDVGGRLDLGAIPKPPHKIESILQAFELTQSNERAVTASIHAIVEQSLAEKDYATHTFMQWFVSEQVEEEAVVSNLLSKVKRIQDNPSALYMLDAELAQRKLDKGV
ncbi:MAG: ferritin [Bacteroidota bacterium]